MPTSHLSSTLGKTKDFGGIQRFVILLLFDNSCRPLSNLFHVVRATKGDSLLIGGWVSLQKKPVVDNAWENPAEVAPTAARGNPTRQKASRVFQRKINIVIQSLVALSESYIFGC